MRSVREVIAALGSPPDIVVRSPGRVNLIGDHTDYNDGFVMPFAIDRDVILAVRQRSDREVHARSLQMNDGVHFDLDRLEHGGPPWGEHLKGVMQESGYTGQGLDLVVSSDVPVGAGLSSSAALEIALARALVALSRTDWDPVATSLACQRAENEWGDAVRHHGPTRRGQCRGRPAPAPRWSRWCRITQTPQGRDRGLSCADQLQVSHWSPTSDWVYPAGLPTTRPVVIGLGPRAYLLDSPPVAIRIVEIEEAHVVEVIVVVGRACAIQSSDLQFADVDATLGQ